jgi:alkanesulfonate monooxygenase SsuD/methylene tetrahydromethanopterin reductase-like flavin-dependent oxidoreductase (luciferase family)
MKIGYLLPTREQVMSGHPEARPLLDLAARAGSLGYDSLWIGDSLLARPRHDPLTLMAAVAARVPRVEIGTAVLLPVLRNPVVLAHQVATVDQISEGRIILGVGIATDVPNIRAEFTAAGVPWEKRVGRLNEGLALCRALWSGKPVDWQGRWTVEKGTLGPVPHRPGGPPIWVAGAKPPSLERIAKLYDGWLPNGSAPDVWRGQWRDLQRMASEAGRAPGSLTGAMYFTAAVDDNAERARERLDGYLSQYYGQPAQILRARQSCFGGPLSALKEILSAYRDAGCSHMVLRFAGDHERHLDTVARLRADLG